MYTCRVDVSPSTDDVLILADDTSSLGCAPEVLLPLLFTPPIPITPPSVLGSLSKTGDFSKLLPLPLKVLVSGQLRKMDGEKDKFSGHGEVCIEVGDKNPLFAVEECSL